MMTKPAKLIKIKKNSKQLPSANSSISASDDKTRKNNKNQDNDLAEKRSPVPAMIKTAGKSDRKYPLTKFENPHGQ